MFSLVATITMDNTFGTESSNLLPPAVDPAAKQPSALSSQQSVIGLRRLFNCYNVCLPSKAAIYILFSAAVVGCIYYTLMGITTAFIISSSPHLINVAIYFSLPYAILALVMIFYPWSGFIADVYCGRFRVIRISLCFLLIYLILVCAVEITGLAKLHSVRFYKYSEFFHSPLGVCVVIFSLMALIFFVFGQAGYQANFIQFGLDQLLEAPSHHLGLFVHYVVWTFQLGSLPISLFPIFWCKSKKLNMIVRYILYPLPIVMLLSVSVLLFINHSRKSWFFTETRQRNPYKTIFNVIDFARNHKYPLRPSAFTYSDNYIPSRLDFAKERYGGPFTTEQVENVKTFLRILLVLLSVGPVFMLEVPASYFVFPLLSFHMFQYIGTEPCLGENALETLFIGSGNLMFLISTVIFFPLYIWITFSSPHRKFKGLFKRIQVGAILCLLGVTMLLIIDTVGHSLKQTSFNQTESQCVFQFHRTKFSKTLFYPALNMHWSVLIPSNLLLGVGPILMITTTLEFIAAQSPQSMKGFLIGAFFAIRGLFQFLNTIIIIPLSLEHPWASGKMLQNPPITNCGFAYLLFTCVVGAIGFVLLSVAAKKYKYRRRDEGMFRQQDVEEIYDRYLQEASINS